MPLLTGPLTPGGAVIDVLVGVSRPRRALLLKHQFPVPVPVHVRAVIDTGASVSGFSPRVFGALDLTPVGQVSILTPSTPADAPHESDLYDVSPEQFRALGGADAPPFLLGFFRRPRRIRS